jgi:general secretion pathway protein G
LGPAKGAEGTQMLVIKASLKRPQQGFTLLEIMVVVVIIGLLAAAVVPQFMQQVDKAQINRAKQDLRTLDSTLQLYRLDNFRYPNTEDGLEALVRSPGQDQAPNWKPLLKSVPLDPWKNPYQYRFPGQRGEFDVFTLGADRQEGGEGVNADISNADLE